MIRIKLPAASVAVACIAAFTLCLPITVSAQSKSVSPSPAASVSPAEGTSSSEAVKPARAIPMRGTVSAVDGDAKTFTIAAKASSRVFKVTDKTTVTKNGAATTFADIAPETKITGSYWKQADGTLEAKLVKIGGAETPKKSTGGKKSKDAATAPDESESPAPKK